MVGGTWVFRFGKVCQGTNILTQMDPKKDRKEVRARECGGTVQVNSNSSRVKTQTSVLDGGRGKKVKVQTTFSKKKRKT